MLAMMGITAFGGAVWYYDKEYGPLDLPEPLANLVRDMQDSVDDQMGAISGHNAVDKLLPDHPPHLVGAKTLVLDLEDTLIHQTWHRKYGWRTLKRPGLDRFIDYMSQFYEIVIFGEAPGATAELLVQQMDPGQRCIPLYGESCSRIDGKPVKDLERLNRPLSNIILIDDKALNEQLQPENVINVRAFLGEDQLDDTGLSELIPFLEDIVRSGTRDVRPCIKQFRGDGSPGSVADAFNTKVRGGHTIGYTSGIPTLF